MQPIRVLVVDDAAVLRRLVAQALGSAEGIDVVGTAGDGRAALEEVERLSPDLVVMDLEMPELDGIGAVRELRRRGLTLPVVMVSTPTDGGAEATLLALAAGATDFFPKPTRATSPAEAMARVRDGLVPVVRALVPRGPDAAGPHRGGPDPACPGAEDPACPLRGSVHVGRPAVAAPAPADPDPALGVLHAPGPTAAEVRVGLAADARPAAPLPRPGSRPAPQHGSPHPATPDGQVLRHRVVPAPRSVPAPVARAPRPAGWGAPAAPVVRPAARTSPVAPHPSVLPPVPPSPPPGRAAAAPPAPVRGRGAPQLLAIGSSTGGPEALARLVAALPADLPVPVVITQHMPPVFTRQLAVRLDRLGPLAVREAEEGDPLRPGGVLVAPGDRHLLLRRTGGEVVVHLSDAAPVNFCRPAVDVMLRSCVDVHGGGVLAVVLTGMGSDGRDGCADVRRAGGAVLVQDAETSVVWGMPGAVAGAGLADAVLPLDAMAAAVTTAARRGVAAVVGSAR